MTKKLIATILAVAGAMIVNAQVAQAGPNCVGKLYVEKSGVGISAIEHFTARGSSNHQAYLQGRRCVEMHWAARWDRKKPSDCKPANNVDNYGLNDLKQWIENRACEKGWKTDDVQLVFRSDGGAGCSKRVVVASYKMQNRYCN